MSRVVNPELANYMSEANAVLKAHAGVSYSEIYQDVHGDLSAMRVACESGVPAGSFAATVIVEHRLRPSTEAGARDVNLRRAALVAFARENGGWFATEDGDLVTADSAGDTYVLKVTRNEKGNPGFVVERVNARTSELEGTGRVRVEAEGPAEVLGGGADIVDAVRAYSLHMDLQSHSRPSL